MTYYFAVLFGGLIYILFQLNGVFQLPEFSWKRFFKSNLIPTILNLVIGFALVYARKDLETIYPVTMLTALIFGVSGQVTFKKLQDMTDVDKRTYIGVNKNENS